MKKKPTFTLNISHKQWLRDGAITLGLLLVSLTFFDRMDHSKPIGNYSTASIIREVESLNPIESTLENHEVLTRSQLQLVSRQTQLRQKRLWSVKAENKTHTEVMLKRQEILSLHTAIQGMQEALLLNDQERFWNLNGTLN